MTKTNLLCNVVLSLSENIRFLFSIDKYWDEMLGTLSNYIYLPQIQLKYYCCLILIDGNSTTLFLKCNLDVMLNSQQFTLSITSLVPFALFMSMMHGQESLSLQGHFNLIRHKFVQQLHLMMMTMMRRPSQRGTQWIEH